MPSRRPRSTHNLLTTLEQLAEERRVVLYDQLGSGNSSSSQFDALERVALARGIASPAPRCRPHPTGVLAGWDVTPRLGEIRVPGLVLCGRFDEATPLQAETIAAGLPDAELVVFEESAQLAPVEETARFLETVRGFLGGVEQRI